MQSYSELAFIKVSRMLSFVSPFLSLSLVAHINCEIQFQIIYNDLHAKFEETSIPSEPYLREQTVENKFYWRFSRTKSAIDVAKEEAKKFRQIPSVVLNAGDFSIGTSYYTLRKWELLLPLIDALQLDVIGIGSHDFDDGIENLVNFINHIRVPVVCCNLDLRTDPRLNLPNLKPSHILDFDGVKIGVIGFVSPMTMAFSKTGNLVIMDEIPSVQAEAKRLIDNGVRIIIALGNSGFHNDILMAQSIPELSLIVGSHSHLFVNSNLDKVSNIYEAEEGYPIWVKHNSCKVIPIVQAYAFNRYLGRMVAVFNDHGNISSATCEPIALVDSSIPEDEKANKLVELLLDAVQTSLKSPIAHTLLPLQPVDFIKREFESTLGNLVTDALVDFAVHRSIAAGLKAWTSASVAFINASSLLHELGKEGRISIEDVIKSLGEDRWLCEITYPGSAIRDALEYSLISQGRTLNFPNYLYFSGLMVVYDLSKPINQRIESVLILCTDCATPRYEELNLNKNYAVILPRSLWKGDQGFTMLKTQALNPIRYSGVQVRDAVQVYIERKEIIYPILDDRIVVKNIEAAVTEDINTEDWEMVSSASEDPQDWDMVSPVPQDEGFCDKTPELPSWWSMIRQRQ